MHGALSPDIVLGFFRYDHPIVDIVIVAILIYQFLLIIRGRRAVHVLLGLCVLGIIYAAAVWAKLELLHTFWLLFRALYRHRAHRDVPIRTAAGVGAAGP